MWHCYKQASWLIFKAGYRYYYGPLLHHLFPNLALITKPCLAHVTTVLTLMRLAYPSLRNLLEEKLQSETVGQNGRAVLQNLQYTMEFLIPTVLSFIYILLSSGT